MISTTGEYALRAAVFLAQNHPEPQTALLVAEGTRTPQGYLSKVLQSMVRSELVHSQRGLHGGFVLARQPETITVLEILASVGAEPRRITTCPLGLRGHVRLCPVHKLVDEAVAHAEKAFSGASLKELALTTRGITPLCDKDCHEAAGPPPIRTSSRSGK